MLKKIIQNPHHVKSSKTKLIPRQCIDVHHLAQNKTAKIFLNFNLSLRATTLMCSLRFLVLQRSLLVCGVLDVTPPSLARVQLATVEVRRVSVARGALWVPAVAIGKVRSSVDFLDSA